MKFSKNIIHLFFSHFSKGYPFQGWSGTPWAFPEKRSPGLLNSCWAVSDLWGLSFTWGVGLVSFCPITAVGFHDIRRREVEIYTTFGFCQDHDNPLTIIYPNSVSPNLLAYLLVKLRTRRKLAQPKHFPKPDGQGIPGSTETLPWQRLKDVSHTSPLFPLYLPLYPVLSCQTLKDWGL